MNNEKSSKVFIMNNSCLNSSTTGSNEENYTLIGTINTNQQNLKSINIIKVQERQGIYTPKDSVLTHDIDNFNKQVLDFISNDDGLNCDPRHFVVSTTLSGLIFKILRWRRCTGYLVIQKSDYRTRFLCYLYDEIKHNAQSFGTSYFNITGKEIKTYFDD